MSLLLLIYNNLFKHTTINGQIPKVVKFPSWKSNRQISQAIPQADTNHHQGVPQSTPLPSSDDSEVNQPNSRVDSSQATSFVDTNHFLLHLHVDQLGVNFERLDSLKLSCHF